MKELQTDCQAQNILCKYGLSGLNRDDWVIEHYEAGANITVEGRDIAYLRIVLQGCAKAFRTSENGKLLIMCRYISDGLIGEIELLAGKRAAITTITTVTAFDCVAISFSRCLNELCHNIGFSNLLGRILAEKLNSSAENYVSSALHNGKQRLSAYILLNSNGGRFAEKLTDTSCAIGMSYRHLLRLLTELCADGLLKKEKRGYAILNEAEMTQYI